MHPCPKEDTISITPLRLQLLEHFKVRKGRILSQGGHHFHYTTKTPVVRKLQSAERLHPVPRRTPFPLHH
ncbi:hypothetical protein DPMN_183196 [Dreissena polymorpha]|uniref:Uncharacterized protein n=1 Tax=Dreissena polymorpha TaxID=45954 RepID=A0A9D4DGR4_DREPO|nr:hypothetical protein DPMN_183196 [Dreissena polymorpha]